MLQSWWATQLLQVAQWHASRQKWRLAIRVIRHVVRWMMRSLKWHRWGMGGRWWFRVVVNPGENAAEGRCVDLELVNVYCFFWGDLGWTLQKKSCVFFIKRYILLFLNWIFVVWGNWNHQRRFPQRLKHWQLFSWNLTLGPYVRESSYLYISWNTQGSFILSRWVTTGCHFAEYYRTQKQIYKWWFQFVFFKFSPRYLGKISNLTSIFFLDGLVQPPTSVTSWYHVDDPMIFLPPIGWFELPLLSPEMLSPGPPGCLLKL